MRGMLAGLISGSVTALCGVHVFHSVHEFIIVVVASALVYSVILWLAPYPWMKPKGRK